MRNDHQLSTINYHAQSPYHPERDFDEIVSNRNPLAIHDLHLSCRSLASLHKRAMLLHAMAPRGNEPALHWASRRGHLPLIQYLLTRFPVDLPRTSAAPSWKPHAGNARTPSPLNTSCCTAQSSTTPTVTGLLHSTTRAGAWWKSKTSRRLLIVHGAYVRGTVTIPISFAIHSGFTCVTRLLIDGGASQDATGVSGDPLVVSATREAVGILELLLDYSADINASNFNESNALLTAAQYGPLQPVQMLVAREANLRSRDLDGNTPLIRAIMYHQQAIAEYLVGLTNVDIYNANLVGEQSVYLAVRMGYDSVLRSLLSRGSTIHELVAGGKPVLDTAVKLGLKTVFNMLLEHIEMPDAEGVTSLISAIEARNEQMVRLPLEHGADPAHTDSAAHGRVSTWVEHYCGAAAGVGH